LGRRPAQPPPPIADRGSRAVSFAVWRCRGTLRCKPSSSTDWVSTVSKLCRANAKSDGVRSPRLSATTSPFATSSRQTEGTTARSPSQQPLLDSHGVRRDRTIDEPSQSYRSIQHETIHRRPSSIRSLTVTPLGSGLPRIRMRSISANASFRLTSLRAGISPAASRSPALPAPTVFASPRTTQYFSSHQSPRDIDD
jgi:hypothetical protein